MIRTPRPAHPRRPTRLRPTLDHLEGRSLMTVTAGALDPTFGAGSGVVFQPVTAGVSPPGLTHISQVQVGSGGAIIAAGPATVNGTNGSVTYGVVEFNADGTLNTAFGTGGGADAVLPGGLGASAFIIGGQPKPNTPVLLVNPSNGNIFVVGEAGNGGTSYATVVAEFNPDGTPDTSFGTGGVVVLDQATTGINIGFRNGLNLAALQGNDLVVAGSTPAGASSQQVTAVRLTATGALDTTFGTNGVASVTGFPAGGTPPTFTDTALALAIQPNGQAVILADVNTPTTFTTQLIRLNTDGTQDTSLSQSGLIASGIAPNSLAIQPNGDFLLGGSRVVLITPTLARLSPDGNGYQTLTVSNDAATGVNGLALQPNGDIVLYNAGSSFITSFTAPPPVFTAIRVTPNLMLDPTFGKNGVAQLTLPGTPSQPNGSPSSASSVEALAVASNNQIILAGSNYTTTAQGGLVQSSPATDLVVGRLTTTGTAPIAGDYNGDGVADPAIYLTAPGSFAVKTSGGGPGETVQLGSPGVGASIPIPGDYYATGQADLAVYLTGPGVFAVKDPSGKTPGFEYQLGSPGLGASIPVPGDFYATGQTDLAVYLVSSGTFAIKDPSGATPGMQYQLGIPGKGQSIPVPGDYDGTGQDDLAVYLAQAGVWAVKDPTQKTPGFEIQFGMPGLGNSIPVPGDYDGSGRTELAVYLPAQAVLIYRPAFGGNDVTIPFGVPGQGQTLPAPGDYDGSGRTEVAAYIPSQGRFAYRPAKGGNDVYIDYGTPGPSQSIPVTAVVLSPFPGTKPGPGSGSGSGNAIAAPGAMGQADALDFLPDAATTAAKKKGGSSAS